MSKFLSLSMRDYIRSFVVAAGTALLTCLYPVLQAGQLPTTTQLKTAGLSALAAGIAYLMKNLFTNSKDQIAKPEEKQTTTEQAK